MLDSPKLQERLRIGETNVGALAALRRSAIDGASQLLGRLIREMLKAGRLKGGRPSDRVVETKS